ncbi:MAG TPA: efflux RND transporter periplasmic adaptor subunit [Casimicrobiaceae bacterium]|nr:efflux RND transporter periplasmic adaptor subunit [Casimicrobiaceae bacterium]
MPMLRTHRAVLPYSLPLAVVLALAGCGQSQQQGFHGFPPTEVTTIKVEPKSLPATFEYVGQTTGSKEVEVRARVTGILEKRLYQEGAPVKAGQVLFVIDPKPLQAQTAAQEAEVARAQAQKAWNDREVARLKPLAERKAVGQKEADDAISQAELAAAQLKSAEAKLSEVKLSLGYTNVVAPITGLSSRAPKSEGSLVTANDTLLTTISQVDPMWIPFSIAENQQLALNKAVSEGRLTLPKDNAFDVQVRLADGSILDRKGRINFSDTRINPSTGTFEMRAEVSNSDRLLKPGQFVRVKLLGATRNSALAVPQIAVLDGTQGKYVYVVDKDKDGNPVAAVRLVTLGDWATENNTNLWIVETGLKPGDQVIVDGVAKLRPNAPIKLGGAAPPPAAPGSAPAKDAPAAPKA